MPQGNNRDYYNQGRYGQQERDQERERMQNKRSNGYRGWGASDRDDDRDNSDYERRTHSGYGQNDEERNYYEQGRGYTRSASQSEFQDYDREENDRWLLNRDDDQSIGHDEYDDYDYRRRNDNNQQNRGRGYLSSSRDNRKEYGPRSGRINSYRTR